jgi:hypothetical protein
MPVLPTHEGVGWTQVIAIRAPATMVAAWDRAARQHLSRSHYAADRLEQWVAAGRAITIQGDRQGAYGEREHLVKLRFHAHEAQIIRGSAEAAGVTVSALLRTLLG